MSVDGQDAESFPSIEALRHEHDRVLAGAPDEGASSSEDQRHTHEDRVTEFIHRAAATGSLLDDPGDRKAAQAIIDYWVATSYTMSPEVLAREGRARTALKPFDPSFAATVAEKGTALARSWNVKQTELARRILLRLVRLAGSASAVSSPSTRDQLLGLGDVEQSEPIVNELVEIGILKTTETDEGQRVELKFEALIRQWELLRNWVEKRLTFRRAAEAWERGGRSRGLLLFDSFLLKLTNDFWDLNKLELEFKQASRRAFQRFVTAGIALFFVVCALAPIVYLSGSSLWGTWSSLKGIPFLGTTPRIDTVKLPDCNPDKPKVVCATVEEKVNAIRGIADYQWTLPPEKQSVDFSLVTLKAGSNDPKKALNLTNIRLLAPSFVKAEFSNVSFDNAQLTNAAFSLADIQDASFKKASLTFARFDGATISRTNFEGANLYRSIFDRARLCGIDLVDVDLREASFRDVEFYEGDIRKLEKTAWWLAVGWTLDQAKLLSKISISGDLEKSTAFKDEIADSTQKLARSDENTITKADAYNGIAWTKATFGINLDEAEKNAQAAVAIAENLQKQSELANYRDTFAYILLQKKDSNRAESLLRAAVTTNPEKDIMFRYAVALNAVASKTGGADKAKEALAKLAESVGKRGYSPSHELYLLKDDITGEFSTKLDEFLKARRSQILPPRRECPAAPTQ
jgi:uncharacterized protein YjbI with pentapeptide repeats